MRRSTPNFQLSSCTFDKIKLKIIYLGVDLMIFLDSGKSKPQLHGNVLATLKETDRFCNFAQ